jgi:hypothetical protein
VRNAPPDGRLTPPAEVYWREVLKKAHINDGKIVCRPGIAPATHLLQILGGHPVRDGRLLRASLREWQITGLLKVTGELDDGQVLEVANWPSYLPRGPNAPFQWRVMITIDTPRFALLPPAARGLSHVLQSIADAEGNVPRIEDELLRRLGWFGTKDRKLLQRSGLLQSWIDALWSDGRVSSSSLGDRFMQIENFSRTQFSDPDEVAGSGTEMARGGTETEPRRPEVAPTWNRAAGNYADLLKTGDPDLRGSDLRGSDPPNPPRPGGGSQGEFFPNQPERRAAHGRLRAAPKRRRMPPAGPPPQGGHYPEAFEAAWKPYPNHRGHKARAFACWQALACDLGEPALLEQVQRHLGWKVKTHWADGIGVPWFERYLWERMFDDVRPENPEAEKPIERRKHPREDEAARRAEALRLQAEQGRRRAEEQAAAIRAAPTREQKLEAWVLEAPLTDRFHPLIGDPLADEVWERVLVKRLAAFRAEHPADPLPTLLATFVAAKPKHAERAAPRPAPPAPTPPVASGKRTWIAPGGWPPPFADPPAKHVAALRLVGSGDPLADAARKMQRRVEDAAERLARLEHKSLQHQPNAGSG